MFLIDSSAWIEYLRPNGSKKAKDRGPEIFLSTTIVFL